MPKQQIRPEMAASGNPKASLKHLSFVMLVLQNTALGIVSKYSRLVAGPKYNPATAVLLVEMFKFLICLAIVFKVSRAHWIA